MTADNRAANDAVLLGPDSVGQFMPTAVKTIQRKRAPVNSAEAGQSVSYVQTISHTCKLSLLASFALKRIRRTQVRKGMVLVGKTDTPPKGKSPSVGLVMCLVTQIHSRPPIRMPGHGVTPRQHDSTKVSGDDALRRDTGQSCVPLETAELC